MQRVTKLLYKDQMIKLLPKFDAKHQHISDLAFLTVKCKAYLPAAKTCRLTEGAARQFRYTLRTNYLLVFS